MQLLYDNQALLATVKDMSANEAQRIPTKNTPSDTCVVKERRSSEASLLVMNPVASGDNVTTGLNSTHKLKEDLPPLVPCCEGKELQINQDLVRSGLSAISVKHDSVIQCLSMSRACERLQVPPGLVKHRNSFRCLHRPDLKRVPYLRRMTPDELETLFRGYAADLPTRGHTKKDTKDEVTRTLLPPEGTVPAKDIRTKENMDNVETRSGTEDVPAGMRLHGARARLYTSVLAGATAGDQLDAVCANEEYDVKVPEDQLPEDEVQLNEELQIILPPRCDDVTADSSITTTSTENSIS